MAAPTTPTELIALLRKCRLFEPAELDAYLAGLTPPPASAQDLADRLLADNRLTKFQVGQVLKGKHRGFVLGKYKLLDRIGMGGMGQVFLAEHATMGRRVAIKVLPPDRAKNEFAKQRFLREARATGQLDHPNIVKAFDVDADGDIHFLVLEYVDGVSFQELVARGGPVTPERAANYLTQALAGLQYLHDHGFIHRDIKPANLIVDRNGAVKLLDLGLVRSEVEGDDLTRKEDVKFLGTADYLAPEQAVDCKAVDGRADVYGLGATGYFLLTGATPFAGDTVAAKLIAHQMGRLRALHEVAPACPLGLSAVIHKMMEKNPDDRYATPAEAHAELSAWVQSPAHPPTDAEFPSGKPAGLSQLAATVNPFPTAQIRAGGSRGGNSSQTTGSGIRFHADSSGGGSGIPRPGSKDVAVTPAPHIFTPRPPAPGKRPPALPAETTHTALPIPSAKPKAAAKPTIDPALLTPKPVPMAPPPDPVAVLPTTTGGRPGVRHWAGIAVGVLLTVALSAWTSVRAMAGGQRDAAAIRSDDATTPR